jgi:hypothetical protein
MAFSPHPQVHINWYFGQTQSHTLMKPCALSHMPSMPMRTCHLHVCMCSCVISPHALLPCPVEYFKKITDFLFYLITFVLLSYWSCYRGSMHATSPMFPPPHRPFALVVPHLSTLVSSFFCHVSYLRMNLWRVVPFPFKTFLFLRQEQWETARRPITVGNTRVMASPPSPCLPLYI